MPVDAIFVEIVVVFVVFVIAIAALTSKGDPAVIVGVVAIVISFGEVGHGMFASVVISICWARRRGGAQIVTAAIDATGASPGPMK